MEQRHETTVTALHAAGFACTKLSCSSRQEDLMMRYQFTFSYMEACRAERDGWMLSNLQAIRNRSLTSVLWLGPQWGESPFLAPNSCSEDRTSGHLSSRAEAAICGLFII